jgi:uncharacterized protein
MKKVDTIDKLKRHADDIRRMGATSLFLFGSVPRGDAHSESDVDLFIDYDPSSKFNAFDLVGIKQFLENVLEVEIDLTTRDGLHPKLRGEIERSAIRVF